jgi:hypothetical protein
MLGSVHNARDKVILSTSIRLIINLARCNLVYKLSSTKEHRHGSTFKITEGVVLSITLKALAVNYGLMIRRYNCYISKLNTWITGKQITQLPR